MSACFNLSSGTEICSLLFQYCAAFSNCSCVTKITPFSRRSAFDVRPCEATIPRARRVRQVRRKCFGDFMKKKHAGFGA